LAVVAALPALMLFGAWRLAAPKSGAAPDASTTEPPAAVTALATPLLSVRRAPATLALDNSLEAFRAAVQPMLSAIDSSSCVSVAVNGVPVAARNDDVSLRPASNVKVITAAVALEVLGPDHRFTTTVVGPMDPGGVVDGNLYLVGGGDPLLSNVWWNGPNSDFPPFNVTSMEAFADAIVAAGLRRVTGDVVGDASRYDDQWYADTWASVDRFSNVGPISSLLVNDSRERLDRSSNDPAVGGAQVLIDLLRERGVQIDGSAAAGVASGDQVVASIESQPLSAIVAELLTTSDNNTAEMLVKEIGLQRANQPTLAAGVAEITEVLASWGMPMDGVSLVDGSGISDENRVTCALLMALLQRGSTDDPVGQGMALAGAPGSTLADAFIGTELEGVLRGKTGTLNNVDGIADKPGAKTLCGYVPLAGGGAIEFVLLLNGELITDKSVYRPVWDRLAEALSAYPDRPTAAQLAPQGG
jgi:D-alanyl-D-alanine carboxypeptidase/D-alanyl-D-alanine-endopeptidase (penicillin-binding protein 4)